MFASRLLITLCLLGACAHAPVGPFAGGGASEGWRDWLFLGQRYLLAQLDEGRLALHLQTDRPVYRPGDSVWFSVWALDPRTFAPGQGHLTMRLFAADGQAHHVPTHVEGHGGVVWLPVELPGGSYRLEARVGRVTSSRPLTILNYRTPRVASTIDLERESYRPGEVVNARLVVRNETGEPVPETRVVFTWRIGARELARDERVSDYRGHVASSATLPDAIGDGEVVVSAQWELDGASEGTVRPVPVTRTGVELALLPEGGHLVQGLRSRVYVRATDKLGRPVEARGRLVDAGGRTLAPVMTRHEGLGVLEVTATGGLAVELDSGERVALPAAKGRGCVLSAAAVGKDVKTSVTCTEDRSLVMVVAMANQLVHLAPLEVEARKTGDLVVPIGDALADRPGVARVTLFDPEGSPLAERVVFRNLDRRLKLEVKVRPTDGRQAELAPGTTAELSVMATDEAGRALPARLSVAVVDERVLALAPDDDQSLAAGLFLGDEVRGPVPRPSYYFGDAPIREREAALDLVLGTAGYRVFRWSRVIGPAEEVDDAEGGSASCGGTPGACDVDGDGVPGFADECAGDPEDIDGFFDEDGCADPDNDGDGILDVDDACPDDPTNGCRVSSAGGGTPRGERVRRPGAWFGGVGGVDWLGQADGRPRWERHFPVYRPRDSTQGRTDLRATSLWSGRTLAPGGAAKLWFTLSEAVTSHRVLVSALSLDGRALVGQVEASFATALPLSVTVAELRRARVGDRIELPVTVHNRSDRPLDLKLGAVTPEGPVALVQIEMPPGAARTWRLPYTPTREGEVALTAIAEAGELRDAVTTTVRVEPNALRVRETHLGRIDPSRKVVVWSPVVPADASGLRAVFTLQERALLAAESRLVDLMNEPHGCFEQSSAATAMNLAVFELASATGKQALTLSRETRELLIAGRDKLMTFVTPAGGFALYPGHDPQLHLTARALLVLADLARVGVPVDEEVRARALSWLRSHWTGSGYVDPARAGRENAGNVINAVILQHLALAGVALTADEVALLERIAAEAPDAFTLASALWALAVAKPGKGVQPVASRLLAMQAPDGGFPGTSGFMGRGAVDAEVTALSLLALGAVGRHEAFERGFVFLNGAKARTYASVLSVKVLREHIRRTQGAPREDAALDPKKLTLPGVGRWYSRWGGAIVGELAERRSGPLELSWGAGLGPVEARLELSYSTTRPILRRGPLSLSTSLPASLPLGEVGRLKVVVNNPGRDESPTPLIRVPLPAGLELVSSALDELVAQKTIGLWEVIRGELVLYLVRLDAAETREIGVAVKAATPGRWGSAPAVAYPYYDAERMTHAPPLELAITAPPSTP